MHDGDSLMQKCAPSVDKEVAREIFFLKLFALRNQTASLKQYRIRYKRRDVEAHSLFAAMLVERGCLGIYSPFGYFAAFEKGAK